MSYCYSSLFCAWNVIIIGGSNIVKAEISHEKCIVTFIIVDSSWPSYFSII